MAAEDGLKAQRFLALGVLDVTYDSLFLYAALAGQLETDIGFQPIYFVWWEILQQFEVFYAMQWTFQPAVITDFLGLIEVEIGMFLELVER